MVFARIAGWVVVFTATLAFLLWVRDALAPFIIGGVLALLLNPLVEVLCQRGLSRSRAVFNVFFAFIIILTAIGFVAGPVFYAQARGIIESFSNQNNGDLNKTIDRWTNEARQFLQQELPRRQQWIERNSELLEKLDLPTDPKALTDTLTLRLRDRANEFLLDYTANAINTLLGTLLGLLSRVLWLVIIPMSTYFFLLDMPSIQRAFLFLIPPAQRAAVRQLLSEIGALFFRYIRGLVTAAVSYGVVSAFAYWLMGTPNPLLLGVLATVLYPIPYIGSLLIAISSAGFTLLFGPTHPFLFLIPMSNLWQAVAVVATAMTINNLFDLFITPRLVGRAVGLRPLVSLMAVVVGANIGAKIAGGLMGGIWGMLLAVPVATTLKIVLERLLYFVYGEAEFLELPASSANALSETTSADGTPQAEESPPEKVAP
ncbi:MAG: AI-2E family transporter [Fimbriimonadales bacterium]